MKAFSLLAVTFLRLYLRDRLSVMLSLALMVFMMTLFGLAMGDDQFKVVLPVAVLDNAHNLASARLIEGIGHDKLLSVRPVRTQAEMLELIRNAGVIAALELGPSFGAPAAGAGSRMVLSQASNRWQSIGIDRLEQLAQRVAAPGAAPPWRVEQRAIDVVRNRYIDYIFPGMLAMAIMQSGLASGVVLLQAKKIGILRRLRITPLTNAQLLGGFMSGRLLIIGLHLLVLGAVAVFGFGAQLRAPWTELLAVVAIGSISFIGLGVMLAVLAPSFESGSLMVQLFSFPMSFLCGVFFKIDSMPASLVWLAKLLPLTYLAEMMRGTIQRGEALGHFHTELMILAGWLMLAVVLAGAGLRWLRRDES
jgi:ABC-2 type transport system permease protein